MISTEPVLRGAIGEAGGDDLVVLESNHSKWLFDETAHHYLRIPNGADPSESEWRPYHRLLVDELASAFLVFLDPAGSRVLRARRHEVPCESCDVTEQLSVDEILARVSR